MISAMKRNIVLKNEADIGIRVHIVGADEVECEYCTGKVNTGQYRKAVCLLYSPFFKIRKSSRSLYE